MTRQSRFRRAVQSATEYCKRNRHLPVSEQHKSLRRRLQGHINYFGVNGNMSCISSLLHHVGRAWFKWLNRRSQRLSLSWDDFNRLLERYPLPEARVVVSIWSH